MQDGRLQADNSDGAGLLNDLARLGILLRDRPIVILGAGGAAAGIIPLLLQSAPAQITLLNRSAERATHLAASFNDARVRTTIDSAAALVISSVSDGFDDLTQGLPMDVQTIIYDLNYGARAQASQQFAQQRALRWHDGLGMLIEQAAVSFDIWHGVKPDTSALHLGEF
jgi:shikimate dehydrogenase